MRRAFSSLISSVSDRNQFKSILKPLTRNIARQYQPRVQNRFHSLKMAHTVDADSPIGRAAEETFKNLIEEHGLVGFLQYSEALMTIANRENYKKDLAAAIADLFEMEKRVYSDETKAEFMRLIQEPHFIVKRADRRSLQLPRSFAESNFIRAQINPLNGSEQDMFYLEIDSSFSSTGMFATDSDVQIAAIYSDHSELIYDRRDYERVLNPWHVASFDRLHERFSTSLTKRQFVDFIFQGVLLGSSRDALLPDSENRVLQCLGLEIAPHGRPCEPLFYTS